MTSRHPEKMHAIILVGFMGAGKSTVGRALAERLGWTFEDLDDRIERREKQKITEIFGNAGEAEFRRAEHEALKELLKGLSSGAEKVIAFGGGAFVQQSNISLLDAANLPTIFLDASVEELLARCQRQSETQAMERPLLRNSGPLPATIRKSAALLFASQIQARNRWERGSGDRDKRDSGFGFARPQGNSVALKTRRK